MNSIASMLSFMRATLFSYIARSARNSLRVLFNARSHSCSILRIIGLAPLGLSQRSAVALQQFAKRVSCFRPADLPQLTLTFWFAWVISQLDPHLVSKCALFDHFVSIQKLNSFHCFL